ncbi:hypothetical protein M407DRAFT_196756 [Tulasnella calospora MUT 4182]|uniref:Uncharacterized protein n=1 Tax=Tulasnella calospora MUT 4182 TaxID=1051891 RepID=A0A0C3LZQ2_9AGAM|nr:hypothetical protein M407DRAFT_196756 [Tulasnella calospora MUT 4182]
MNLYIRESSHDFSAILYPVILDRSPATSFSPAACRFLGHHQTYRFEVRFPSLPLVSTNTGCAINHVL